MADNIYQIIAQPTADDDGDTIKLENVLVTTAGFTGGLGTLSVAHTSSLQVASQSGAYFIDVYQTTTGSSDAAVQFSISYGNINGSGSTESNDEKPTRAVYYQYKSLLLDDTDTAFSFTSESVSVSPTHIFVMNFKRDRIKDRIDPETFEFGLSGSGLFQFKSLATSSLAISNTKYGVSYPIVSKSIATGNQVTNVFGRLYADLGVVTLNPDHLEVLNAVRTLNTASAGNATLNSILYSAISSSQLDAAVPGADMTMRATERVDSNIYFVRVKSSNFNESSNPTYYSAGRIKSNFISERITYITTVGLYNDANELLAVAKVSQPILKKRGTEALIKVKVDF